jgi:MFS family permease
VVADGRGDDGAAARSARADVTTYAVVATAARSATEAIGPALLLTALASHRAESDGAALVAAFTGLAAVAGPPVGALLDRTARPGRVIMAAVAAMAASAAALAVLVPRAPLLVLLAIAAVGGLAYPALTGGLTSQLPSIVSGPRLDRAWGVDAATYNVGAIVGPPAAAAALVLGASGPVVFLLVLLLVALPLVPRIPFVVRAPSEERASILRDIATGFRALVSTPHLAYATLLTTVGFAGQAAFLVTVPLLAQAQTGSLAKSGYVFAAAAVGGLITTLLVARRPLRHPDRGLSLTTAGIGLSYLVLAASPAFAVTVVAAFAYGAFEGPLLTALFRIRTREADPAVRSQVFTTAASIRTTAFAGMTAVFGALLGLGVTTLLLLGAGLQVLAFAAAAAGYRIVQRGSARPS